MKSFEISYDMILAWRNFFLHFFLSWIQEYWMLFWIPQLFAKLSALQVMQEQLSNTETPSERAKRESRELMETIMRLERENDELAHELINGKIQLRNDLDNAEDMNELQQKEIARLNGLIIDGEDEAKRLRDEAVLVKELCRKIEMENKQQVCTFF